MGRDPIWGHDPDFVPDSITDGEKTHDAQEVPKLVGRDPNSVLPPLLDQSKVYEGGVIRGVTTTAKWTPFPSIATGIVRLIERAIIDEGE